MRLSTVVCSALILGVTASPIASSLVMAQAAGHPRGVELVPAGRGQVEGGGEAGALPEVVAC